MDVQLALGSDIMMVLDECPPNTRWSTTWPETRCAAPSAGPVAGYAHYLRRKDETGTAQALFPIVQGSMFRDLRTECVAELTQLDADGYAIGGLSVGEPREVSLEVAGYTVPLLPRDRPRYVMGVGMPEELPQYVARGVDMMDCVLPFPQRPQRIPVYLARPRNH